MISHIKDKLQGIKYLPVRRGTDHNHQVINQQDLFRAALNNFTVQNAYKSKKVVKVTLSKIKQPEKQGANDWTNRQKSVPTFFRGSQIVADKAETVEDDRVKQNKSNMCSPLTNPVLKPTKQFTSTFYTHQSSARSSS